LGKKEIVHKDVDMIIWQGKEVGIVKDYFSIALSSPPLDIIDNVQDTEISIIDDKYYFTTYRDMDTGDSDEDWKIPFDEEFLVVWVECTSTAELVYHTNSGTFMHVIDSPSSDDSTP